MVQQYSHENRGVCESGPGPESGSVTKKSEGRREVGSGSGRSYNTATYFKEMAQYSTLDSVEEISLGMSIREKRQQIWCKLLELEAFPTRLLALLERDSVEIPFALIQLLESLKSRSRAAATLERRRELLDITAKKMTSKDLDEVLLKEFLRDLNRRLDEIKAKRSRTKKQARELLLGADIQKRHSQLQRVKHKFINANLRLVISVARRYNNGPMNLIDLIQEGNIGLMKAVDRFDPDRGYRFSTYAAWWIRHAVSRASADKGRTVRLPVHFIESYQQVMKIKRELQRSLDRTPTSEEVAKEMGISRRKVDRIEGYLREGTLSLNRTVNSDDSRSFMELLEDPSSEAGICGDVIHCNELKMSNTALHNVLNAMERDIINKRYGLGKEDPCTLKEIGGIYDLSRERIRQIQENALKKMRRFFKEQGML